MYQSLITIKEDEQHDKEYLDLIDTCMKDNNEDLDIVDTCIHTSYLVLILVFIGSLILILFAWFNNYTFNEDFFY